jgi:hypothetical protein
MVRSYSETRKRTGRDIQLISHVDPPEREDRAHARSGNSD